MSYECFRIIILLLIASQIETNNRMKRVKTIDLLAADIKLLTDEHYAVKAGKRLQKGLQIGGG